LSIDDRLTNGLGRSSDGVSGDESGAGGGKDDCGFGQGDAAGGIGGDSPGTGNVLGGKLVQSPGKIGGCHAMAPSCAAENGAGAAGAKGFGLMKGSVQ
jgi:hypothetical protein